MTFPNSTDQTSQELEALQSKVNSLEESVQLANTRNAIEELNNIVNALIDRIIGLRKMGYVFERGLENQAQRFTESWKVQYPNLQSQVSLQSSILVNSLHSIEIQISRLAPLTNNPPALRPFLANVQSSVTQLENKVSIAEKTLDELYEQIRGEVTKMVKHLDEIEFMMKQLEEASFQLLATEAGIIAVKAVWYKTDKEQKGDPEGVLYLTDQRLIFEHKEEIATKRVLFVTTEKKRVQELVLVIPVAQVEKIEVSKQGLLKNEDHIEIHLSSDASEQSAHFHIWQENTTWQALINRAKNKDFDQERVIPVEQEILEKVKAAPTKCPSCGGDITTVILRGMDTIKCSYCGTEIRL